MLIMLFFRATPLLVNTPIDSINTTVKYLELEVEAGIAKHSTSRSYPVGGSDGSRGDR